MMPVRFSAALFLLLFFSIEPFSPIAPAAAHTNGKSAAIEYIHSLAKPGGGFGWSDQPDPHLTPAFAAVGVLHHLGSLPSDHTDLIEFFKTHHPQRNPYNREAGPSGTQLRDLVYQQIQGILWLDGDASGFAEEVKGWKSQAGLRANFERHGYPAFMQEMMSPIARDLLSLTQDDGILAYIHDRRRQNGSFNNAPLSDGGDGNILNTYWGLYALGALGRSDNLRTRTIQWINACRMENGGFTHQPNPVAGVNDEVAYTWAAVKALDLLSAEPDNKQAVVRYLLSLQNSDGGFGNRPGLPSTPMATFYAVDALKTLNSMTELEAAQPPPPSPETVKDYSGYNIYTVQFQAPGSGSLKEAIMLADSLNIDLWGAKNADREWILAARKLADEKNVPVTFFHSNEDYGKHITVDGMGSFNHLFDPIFPVERNYASPRWTMRQDYFYSWDDYRNEFTKSLLEDKGANLWQVSHNEPLARLMLDDSVNKGGFAAVSTVHFNQNFLFWLPHLYQYRHQLAFIALQDFHGTESWWWANELVHYRNLYLAKEPTYEAMLEALMKREIVTVRHDELTNFNTRILGGAPGVQEYILSKKDEWKWWDESTNELNHPWVSVTALTPEDVYEVGRPENGVNIRIRCWWHGFRQSLDEPLVDLVQLKINGMAVEPEYQEKRNQRGVLTDAFYLYSMEHAEPGENIIEAQVQSRENGSQRTVTVSFSY